MVQLARNLATPTALFLILAISIPTGCARPDVRPHMQELAAHDEAFLAAPPPDPATKILNGLDDVRTAGEWTPGAEVLYVVRIEHGETTRVYYARILLKTGVLRDVAKVRVNPPLEPPATERTMDVFDSGQGSYELEVVGWDGEAAAQAVEGEAGAAPRKFHSDAVLAWMGLYDESGRLESARYTLLPEAYLRMGLMAMCEIAASLGLGGESPREMTPGQAAVVEESDFAVRCLGKVVAESHVARPIVRGVVPGFDLLWMLIIRPKFTHTLRSAVAADAEGLPAVEKYGPACRLELDVNVNGNPMVRCHVVTAPPRSPIDLCAGVLSIQCAHLDDPSRRVSVNLLAARRPAPPDGIVKEVAGLDGDALAGGSQAASPGR